MELKCKLFLMIYPVPQSMKYFTAVAVVKIPYFECQGTAKTGHRRCWWNFPFLSSANGRFSVSKSTL
ncbi:hypothetical protein [Methylomonas albis]|nr:hypothetical protein [Methylomonas albis]